MKSPSFICGFLEPRSSPILLKPYLQFWMQKSANQGVILGVVCSRELYTSAPPTRHLYGCRNAAWAMFSWPY